MRAHVIMPGNPAKVEEQEVADGVQAIVIPLPSPPAFAREGETLSPVASAYPQMILQAHWIQHTDPREPRRITAFWPSTWADEWGMDALRAAGVIS